jgi:hypothetical protein
MSPSDEEFAALGRDITLKGATWCLGMLHELEVRKLVDGADGERLTPKGIAEFDQLKSSGWIPPKDLALALLSETCGENAEVIWQLMQKILAEEITWPKKVISSRLSKNWVRRHLQ